MGRNMEKKKEYDRQYRQSEKGKKIRTFHNWRQRGIIHHNWDLLYKIYLEAKKCDFCKCILDTSNKTKRCLDHDHSITDGRDNVRAILCFNCNVKDVYNPNKKLRKTNTSGFQYIYYDKTKNRWLFSKIINKEKFSKTFETKTDALCCKFAVIILQKNNIKLQKNLS